MKSMAVMAYTNRGRTGMTSEWQIVGADCSTDHRLVISNLNLRIQPARRP